MDDFDERHSFKRLEKEKLIPFLKKADNGIAVYNSICNFVCIERGGNNRYGLYELQEDVYGGETIVATGFTNSAEEAATWLIETDPEEN